MRVCALLALACVGCNAQSGASSGENASMLSEHNQVRANASPAPSPALTPLAWSDTVAQVAQSWAQQCQFAHNANRGDVGENIYASTGGATPAQVVSTWASESADYDYASNTCAPSKVCGHYTQLVWRSTQSLGCGKATCTVNSPFPGFTQWELWVCDYQPPGNLSGQRPY
jgi:uncharacterized protein YkwD